MPATSSFVNLVDEEPDRQQRVQVFSASAMLGWSPGWAFLLAPDLRPTLLTFQRSEAR